MTDKNRTNIIDLATRRSQRPMTIKEFTRQPLAQKLAQLRSMPPGERMANIIADPAAREVVDAFSPQELYLLVTDVGLTDTLELISFANPEQILFMFDMEAWNRWSFSSDKMQEWFELILETGEEKTLQLLDHLDHELLLLFFMNEVYVWGGMTQVTNEEERTTEWDHSFDGIYYLKFLNSQHSSLVGRLLEFIYASNRQLYMYLMEGVRTESKIEAEELCYRFRTARMEDLGFPEAEQATEIYAYFNPATFRLAHDKSLPDRTEQLNLPAPLASESLLGRVIARLDSLAIIQELNYLINKALSVEGAGGFDSDTMRSVFQRIYGCLNIALESLSAGSEEIAAEIITGEYLQRLFQHGYSILLDLKSTALKYSGQDTSLNHPVNRALLGLKANRPRFYRGFDPDTVDDYREFRDLADVIVMREFLSTIAP